MNVGEILVKFGAEITGFTMGIKGVMAGLAALKTGASEIAFGMQNMGTAGNIGMGALSQGVTRVGSGLLMLGGLVAVAAAGIAIAFGVHAVKAAGDFQQGLNRLVTGAGDVTDNMKQMGQAILGVSASTGVLTGQLIPAMYLIISSGQRGAQAIDTLRVASQGAVIEQAKVADVANVLSGVMTNYGTHTYNATQFMNGLIVAVQQGKITLQDLAVAMGPIDPIAKSMGISFNDVAAAMTTQTNAMIPAARAATGLRFMMQALENPTHKAKAAMEAMGLDSVKVAEEMKVSLPGALEMIYKAALKAGPEGSVPFVRALSDMVGGMRSVTTFTALTGSHFKDFARNSLLIKEAMDRNKAAVLGWETAQSGFNVKMDQARAALAALAIIIGTAILPELSRLLDIVMPLISSFTQWVIQSHVVENAMHSLVSAIGTVVSVGTSIVAFFKNNELAMSSLKGVLITVAAVIAIALVAALYSAATAAWAFAAGMIAALWPVYLIAAAVALVVIAFIHFYNTSAGFRSVIDAIVGALKAAWNALVQFGSYLIGQIGPGIAIARQFFVQLWATLQQGWAIVLQVAAALARIGVAIYSAVLPFVTMLAGIIRAQFIPVWAQLMASWTAMQPVLAQLSGVFRMLWSTIQQLAAVFMAQLMPTLQSTWSAMQKLWAIVGPQVIPALEALAMIVGGVLLVSLGLLVGILTGVTGALAAFLSGAIQVVQGVTQVFVGLAQFLTGIVAFITDLFTGHFERLSGDLGMIWQGILNILQGAGTAMVGIFNATFGVIIGFVSGFANGVIGFFTTLYHSLVGGSIVPDMCNAIVAAFTGMISSVISLVMGFIVQAISLFISLGVNIVMAVTNAKNQAIAAFNNLKSQAIGVVQSLVSSVGSILNTLAGIAASAGQAMISALVGQINAGVGWVSSAISNVVAAIGNVLPHSPAKEGPLRDLNKFGPAITHGLATGIIAGSPEVTAAVNMMIQPFKGPITASRASSTASQSTGSASAASRPIIIQVGNREYRAFVDNLGNDLVGSSTVRVHFAGGR